MSATADVDRGFRTVVLVAGYTSSAGRLRAIMTFLTTLPLWLSAVVLIVPTTLFAMAGPVIVRRYVGLSQLRTNNEVGGFKFATVGVLYAVINDISRQGIFDFDTPRLQLKHGPPIRWPIASAGDASPRGMVVRCLNKSKISVA